MESSKAILCELDIAYGTRAARRQDQPWKESGGVQFGLPYNEEFHKTKHQAANISNTSLSN
jgi:hypothetical protein